MVASIREEKEVEEGGGESISNDNEQPEPLPVLEGGADPLTTDELVAHLNLWSSRDGLLLSTGWYRDFVGNFEKDLERKGIGSALITPTFDINPALTAATAVTAIAAAFLSDNSLALTATVGVTAPDLDLSGSVSGGIAATTTATASAAGILQSGAVDPSGRVQAPPAAKRKKIVQSDDSDSCSLSGGCGGDDGGGYSCGDGDGGGDPTKDDSDVDDEEGESLMPAISPQKRDLSKRSASKLSLERTRTKAALGNVKLKSKTQSCVGSVGDVVILKRKISATGSASTGGRGLSIPKKSRCVYLFFLSFFFLFFLLTIANKQSN